MDGAQSLPVEGFLRQTLFEDEQLLEELPALHGQRVLLTDQRILIEGRPTDPGGWAAAFLENVAAVQILPEQKARRELIWGIIGLLAAVGVWRVASSGAVGVVGGVVVGAMALFLLGDYLFRPGDLNLVVVGGSHKVAATVARSEDVSARSFAKSVMAARSALQTRRSKALSPPRLPWVSQ